MGERILLIGAPGSGKSFSWLTIAAANPDHQFHCVDTDAAITRMMRKPLPNVHATVAFEWQDMMDALQSFKLDENSWVVIDMISAFWDAVQRYFSEQVYGVDLDEYWLEARKSQKKGNPFDGRTDWGTVNRIYNRFTMGLLKVPGHLLATAPVEQIASDEKDGGILATFGAYGVKPRGQKHLAHLFHTVLLLTKSRTNEYRYTTIKDRARKDVEKQPLTNFHRDYLQAIGGW